ncbi:DUF6297 family protein [Solwaraspora sp. WMMA2101]|uniref:DUF6297 family protein n=1 Tax=Solwaraspora sp. WMMA2101 TaxID=3404124 RepID=UPI003B9593E9
MFLLVAIVTAARTLAAATSDGSDLPSSLLLAATLGCFAVILAIAAAFGPLSAPPAALTWLATSPVSRRGLLLPRFAAVVTAGAVAGALFAILVLPYLPARDSVALVGLGLALGVTTAAGAALTQVVVRRPERLLRGTAAVAGLAAFATAFADISGFWSGPPVRGLLPGGAPWVVGAVLTGLVVVAAAYARLEAVRLPALRAAAASAAALTGGIGAADPGLLSRVTEDRRWQQRRLRVRIPLPPGSLAVVGHDLLTFFRQPGRVVVWTTLAAVPWLLASLSESETLRAAGWLLAGLLATGQFTGNVRYDMDRPTIARLIGVTDRRLLIFRSVLPTVLAVAWSTGSVMLALAPDTGNVTTAALLGLTAGPAVAAGALRSARRSFVRHDYPLIVTPMGVVPSGPFVWAGQAVDLALLGTAPTLIALATRDVDLRTIVAQAVFSALALGLFLRPAGRSQWAQGLVRRGWAMIARAVTVIWRL